jgi:hypothetical protein
MQRSPYILILIFKKHSPDNHQQPTFHPLGDFLNPALALLGQGLKKSPIGQKLDFANHPRVFIIIRAFF